MKVSDLTNDQKIILHLAINGHLNTVGDVGKALRDPQYAIELLSMDVPEEGELDNIIANYESLTNDEIQSVFDNDKFK